MERPQPANPHRCACHHWSGAEMAPPPSVELHAAARPSQLFYHPPKNATCESECAFAVSCDESREADAESSCAVALSSGRLYSSAQACERAVEQSGGVRRECSQREV